jgi:transposase
MYITNVKTKTKSGEISHECLLLRYSYRENGKVKNKTLLNLNKLSKKDADAIIYAVKHKDEIAGQISGELALWQIFARVIDQGSCLSSVRLASYHAACDVLDIDKSFNEDDLYKNLAWLCRNQKKIEKKLFDVRYKENKQDIFLYDVTSSYLKGLLNALGARGYNRDGKRGKLQIVAGLMCDKEGDPISIEIFEGNTVDYKTMRNQIDKVSKHFNCENVTFVGDRGMIKSDEIDDLEKAGFHYITAITKPQIRKLINDDVIQMSLFDNDLEEVESDGVRYILRRNPARADEIRRTRSEKLHVISEMVAKKNEYLRDHRRAKVETAIKDVNNKIAKFKMDKWLGVSSTERKLELRIDAEQIEEISRLDGCYVIKSDLSYEFGKEEIHDRYKDLYYVEQAFRCSKTEMLEMRPWFVWSEESMRGRALVVMLAYVITRHLKRLWSEMNLTVQEGIRQLSTLCTVELMNKEQTLKGLVPKPNDINAKLLKLAGVNLPMMIPSKGINVVSRKKLVIDM